MSRLTKYLRQKCLVEKKLVDEDTAQPTLDRFGQIQYQPAQKSKCRKETTKKVIQVANGQLAQATARYYFDEKLEIADDDRVDGHVVLSSKVMTNASGKTEGYTVYV